MDGERILIVEDDETLVSLLSEALNSVGYEVESQNSAFGAAARVRELQPSAVLLDIGLPFRPGTSVLAELKSDPRTADVPVLVVSGMTGSLSEKRRAQADVILAKPFGIDSLLDAVSLACAKDRKN